MDDDDTLDIWEAKGGDDEPETSAVALLAEDHDELRQAFQDYAALGDSEPARGAKQSLVDGLLQLLETHLAVEEDVYILRPSGTRSTIQRSPGWHWPSTRRSTR